MNPTYLNTNWAAANITLETVAGATSLAVPNGTIFPTTDDAGKYVFGDSTTQFTITDQTNNRFRYTWTGVGTTPSISATSLKQGYVVVIAAQNFNAANNGTFAVIKSGTNYFDVYNAAGVAEATKTLGTGSLTRPVAFKAVIFAPTYGSATEAANSSNKAEILKCTRATGSNTINIVRAQEGTTDQTHAAGAFFMVSPTADKWDSVETEINTKAPIDSPTFTGNHSDMGIVSVGTTDKAGMLTGDIKTDRGNGGGALFFGSTEGVLYSDGSKYMFGSTAPGQLPVVAVGGFEGNVTGDVTGSSRDSQYTHCADPGYEMGISANSAYTSGKWTLETFLKSDHAATGTGIGPDQVSVGHALVADLATTSKGHILSSDGSVCVYNGSTGVLSQFVGSVYASGTPNGYASVRLAYDANNRQLQFQFINAGGVMKNYCVLGLVLPDNVP